MRSETFANALTGFEGDIFHCSRITSYNLFLDAINEAFAFILQPSTHPPKPDTHIQSKSTSNR